MNFFAARPERGATCHSMYKMHTDTTIAVLGNSDGQIGGNNSLSVGFDGHIHSTTR